MDADRPDPEPTPSPALRSNVSLDPEEQYLRDEMARSTEADGPWLEIVANYAEWLDLMQSWNRGDLNMSDADFEAACIDHLDRSVALGEVHAEHWNQRWASWISTNTTTYDEGVA
jgi:hypothetical protein